MRQLGYILLSLVFLVGTAAWAYLDHMGKVRSMNTVTLPVLVSYPLIPSASFQVQISDVSNVNRLWFRTHSIGYQEFPLENDLDHYPYNVTKASVRVNNGSWVHISSSTASCEYPANQIGCIEGPLSTIKFTMGQSALINQLQNGTNTIEFRYNLEVEDPSTGFRILGVRALNSSGRDQIDGTTFVWDNPANWSPPSGSSVSTGRSLWNQRGILDDGPIAIEAACADCHAKNGRDLEYFAYSNDVITSRSMFHGLTEQEGENIAAYVRDHTLRHEDGTVYDPPGRPWEPPYQPGPTALATRSPNQSRTSGQGFYDIPQNYWAAGAGLDWVLTNDRDSYPYVFPGGISPDDVWPAPETSTTEDQQLMPEIPFSLQMPDWNEWLPVHHPMDAYGDDFINPPSPSSGQCQGDRTHAWDYYNNEVQTIDGSTSAGVVDQIINNFSGKVTSIHRCGGYVTPDPGYDSKLTNADVKRWRNIKIWETVHTYHHEDKMTRVYDGGEPLAWPSDERHMFDVAPHIVHGAHDTYKGWHQSYTVSYYDTGWYQHQLTLNSGHGENVGISPVDWNYHPQYIGRYERHSGTSQRMRYVSSFIEVLQSGPLAPNGSVRGSPKGWDLSGPLNFFFLKRGAFNLNSIVDNGYCHTLDAILQTYVDGMAWRDPNEWDRDRPTNSSGKASNGIESESYVPQVRPDGNHNPTHPIADALYTLIDDWSDVGVPTSTLNPIADWGDKAWPLASPSFRSKVDQNNSSCPALGSFQGPEPEPEPQPEPEPEPEPTEPVDTVRYRWVNNSFQTLQELPQEPEQWEVWLEGYIDGGFASTDLLFHRPSDGWVAGASESAYTTSFVADSLRIQTDLNATLHVLVGTADTLSLRDADLVDELGRDVPVVYPPDLTRVDTATTEDPVPIPPVATISWTADGLTVDFEFTGKETEEPIIGYEWLFGDGSTSTEQNPQHTYAAAGTYVVSLRAYTENTEDTVEEEITVEAPTSIEGYTDTTLAGTPVRLRELSIHDFSGDNWEAHGGTVNDSLVYVQGAFPRLRGAYKDNGRIWYRPSLDSTFQMVVTRDSATTHFQGFIGCEFRAGSDNYPRRYASTVSVQFHPTDSLDGSRVTVMSRVADSASVRTVIPWHARVQVQFPATCHVNRIEGDSLRAQVMSSDGTIHDLGTYPVTDSPTEHHVLIRGLGREASDRRLYWFLRDIRVIREAVSLEDIN